ncbi:MAG: formylglycine-generating enzyme family protein [Proteobacteria bacterium]|nr:formylglycine-generating enzyme family protein [Pseudomonadota bacterium]
MRKYILSGLSVLFMLTATQAFADDMVRIPASGDKADGYTACAIEAQSTCTASDVKKKSIPAFYIDAKPVTNDELQACIDSGKCILDEGTQGARNNPNNGLDITQGKHPAVVTFSLAEQYCASVGKKLPTEEQWLAAALIEGVRKYSWGDEDLATAAAHTDLYNFSNLVDVGSMPSDQAGGIYDMSGNGLEWIDARIMKAETSEYSACATQDSRACMGAVPLPLYQKIGIYSRAVATFRCVKSAE